MKLRAITIQLFATTASLLLMYFSLHYMAVAAIVVFILTCISYLAGKEVQVTSAKELSDKADKANLTKEEKFVLKEILRLATKEAKKGQYGVFIEGDAIPKRVSAVLTKAGYNLDGNWLTWCYTSI